MHAHCILRLKNTDTEPLDDLISHQDIFQSTSKYPCVSEHYYLVEEPGYIVGMWSLLW